MFLNQNLWNCYDLLKMQVEICLIKKLYYTDKQNTLQFQEYTLKTEVLHQNRWQHSAAKSLLCQVTTYYETEQNYTKCYCPQKPIKCIKYVLKFFGKEGSDCDLLGCVTIMQSYRWIHSFRGTCCPHLHGQLWRWIQHVPNYKTFTITITQLYWYKLYVQ